MVNRSSEVFEPTYFFVPDACRTYSRRERLIFVLIRMGWITDFAEASFSLLAMFALGRKRTSRPRPLAAYSVEKLQGVVNLW